MLIVFSVIVTAYAIISQVVVCHKYLVPAVLVISDVTRLSRDVVGGTFLAFAVSLPLLLANLMSFPDIPNFEPCPNLHLPLALAMCCFFKRWDVAVVFSSWCFVRNVLVNALLILSTFSVYVANFNLSWHQPTVPMLLFSAYVLFMFAFNDRLRTGSGQSEIILGNQVGQPRPTAPSEQVTIPNDSWRMPPEIEPRHGGSTPPPEYSETWEPHDATFSPETPPPAYSSLMVDSVDINGGQPPLNVGGSASPTASPHLAPSDHVFTATIVPEENAPPREDPDQKSYFQCLQRLCHLLFLFPLQLTLPDVQQTARRKYYIVSYLGSIAWICIFQVILLWVRLKDPWMPTGVALYASSVIIVRKELSDMTFSLIYGSSIFDLAIGVPLPVLVAYLLKVGTVRIRLLESMTPLLFQLVFMVAFSFCKKKRFNRSLGCFMVVNVCIHVISNVTLWSGHSQEPFTPF